MYFLLTSTLHAAAIKFMIDNIQEFIVAREEFAVKQESNKILIRSSAMPLK